MIKLVYCIRRRQDLSPDAFRKHWLEVHAPKVERCAKALRARRYVQSHALDTVLNDAFRDSRGAGRAFDGITEVWWDSEEDLAAAMRTDEGVKAGRALLEDERNFIQLEDSALFLTEEHEVF